MAALKEKQQARKNEESARLSEAADMLADAIRKGDPNSFNPTEHGFEFTRTQILDRLARLHPELMKNCTSNRKAA
jgi:hypothetical protein